MDFSILPFNVIEKLSYIGITDINSLQRAGVVKVFLLLKRSRMTITNCILWQLDSLARGISLNDIDHIRKKELLQQVRSHYPIDLFPDIDIMNKFMEEALKEAKKALINKEVPVGAVIIYNNEIISRGYNETISKNSIDNHAEIVAIRRAGDYLGSYRLNNCDIYVTLEPCTMCCGAIINSRIRRLIFGLKDYKTGVAGGVVNIFQNSSLNKFTSVLSGIKSNESKQLLQNFFCKIR